MRKISVSLLVVVLLAACSAIEDAPKPPATPAPPATPTPPSPVATPATTAAPSPAATPAPVTTPTPAATPAQPTIVPAAVMTINAKQAKELMDQMTGYAIVDVRTAAEYKQAHIKGAVLVPVDQIAQLAPEKLPDKAQPLFVYCRSGGRSAQAAKALVKLGYTTIYDFGGINSWPYGTVTG